MHLFLASSLAAFARTCSSAISINVRTTVAFSNIVSASRLNSTASACCSDASNFESSNVFEIRESEGTYLNLFFLVSRFITCSSPLRLFNAFVNSVTIKSKVFCETVFRFLSIFFTVAIAVFNSF